jgi:hypothetical protein
VPTSSTTNQIYIPGLTDQINDGIANITPQQMVEERFYDSGVWTKPDGVNRVEVIVVGGGGGGGASRYGNVGGGGGAGEYRRATFAVSSGVNITVGTGGTGGLYDRNPGNPGNQSSFGTLLVADGGQGGMGGSNVGPIRTYGSTGGATWDGVNNYNHQAGGGGGAGSPGKSGDHGPHPRYTSWSAHSVYKRRNSWVNTGGFGAYNDNSSSYSPTFDSGMGGEGIDGIAGGGAGGGQTYSYDSNSYAGYRLGHSGGGDSGFARLRGKAWNLTNNTYYDLDQLWMHDGLPAIPGTGSGGGGANMLPQSSNYHMTRSEWADPLVNPFRMEYGNTDYRGWRSITDLVASLPGETGYATGTAVSYNGENWSWQAGSQRMTASTSGKAVMQPNSLMPYVYGLHYVPSVGTFASYQPGGSTTTQFGWAIYNRDRQLLGYTLKATQYSTGTGWTSSYGYNGSTNDYNTFAITNNFYHPDAFFMAPIIYVNNVIAGSYYACDTSDSGRYYNSGRGGDGGKGIVIVRYAVK